MAVIGLDNRTIISDPNVFPLYTVTTVDSEGIFTDPSTLLPKVRGIIGTGIVISPNHVLTAGHNSYYYQGTGEYEKIRVTLSINQGELITRDLNATFSNDETAELGKGVSVPTIGVDPDANIVDENYPSDYNVNNRDGRKEDDIVILKTAPSDVLLPANSLMGILAFVDPQDSVDLEVSTAGYPGDNRNISGSAIGIGSGRELAFASGTIEETFSSSRQVQFSPEIDAARGQSGSGIWHKLEGDDFPRVLGVLSIGNASGNKGVVITDDIYSSIMSEIESSEGIGNADELPENAIIGSENADEIIGSYRKERILGNNSNDTLLGHGAEDRLEGGEGDDLLDGGSGDDHDELKGDAGNDVLQAGAGDDFLTGGADNDILDGGEGTQDIAFFADSFSEYSYEKNSDGSITFDHADGTGEDGTDTLRGIEWGLFQDEAQDLDNLSSSEEEVLRRFIPLPLEDGVETTKSISAIDTTVNPNPNDPPTPPYISLTAPVAMLDGDIDYTLNISPYEPDTEYNVVYVIDTSSSIDPVELQTIKDAYTDLTNFYLAQDNAENINFGVVSYDSSGRFYPDAGGDRNLTADEALVALQNLTIDTGIGTRYYDGLNQADQFLLNSRYNPFFTTSIGYFFTDGQNSGDRLDMLLKARDVRELANFQAIGYYSDLDTLTSNSLKIRDVNWIDSNQGVFIDNLGDLAPELLKSDLADDVVEVNILLDGEIVDTLTPEMLTDTPLGLTYEGELDELDVSIDAENVITAEVVFTPEANLETTTVEHIVTAGEGEVIGGDGNPIDESGSGNEDQDPFEKIRNGGDSNDRITLGYVDRGANGGEGGDYIIGNNRDNILDGGAGNDTILGHGGDDTITPGEGRDKVDGGEGIDTVLYSDVIYQDNANIFLRRAGNTVSYNNTDSLTNIEYLQFADVRLDAETFEVAPIVEVEDITIVEGNSATSLAQFTFNLDAPTTAEITFNYSTEDISATADSDYNAIAGQVIMTGGETTATVEVEVIGDRTEEDHESFNNIVLITRRLQLFTV